MVEDACAWVGLSGSIYEHFIFELDAELPDRLGTYVYAKQVEGNKWAPVYFGHGSLAQRCSADRDLMVCIRAKGATHVHLRLNAMELDRVAELQDMLQNYPNAFAPHGCHERVAV